MLKKFLSFVLYGKSFSTKERKERLLKRTYEACRNYEADNANRVLNEIYQVSTKRLKWDISAVLRA